jgi:hypothetical protein
MWGDNSTTAPLDLREDREVLVVVWAQTGLVTAMCHHSSIIPTSGPFLDHPLCLESPLPSIGFLPLPLLSTPHGRFWKAQKWIKYQDEIKILYL